MNLSVEFFLGKELKGVRAARRASQAPTPPLKFLKKKVRIDGLQKKKKNVLFCQA